MNTQYHKPTIKPARIQLSRKKGFNLQRVSNAVNGLEAVNVARPTIWGNPWHVGTFGHAQAVALYQTWIDGTVTDQDLRNGYGQDSQHVAEFLIERRKRLQKEMHKLTGKNLACWCPQGTPCHADVLIKLANEVEQ